MAITTCDRMTWSACLMAAAVGFLAATGGATAWGQVLEEDFDAASGIGGVEVLSGSGYNDVDTWDDELSGEWSYAGTWGDCIIGSASVRGVTNGGFDGTGGGELTVAGATFTDGGWFAGMFWPDLVLPTLDPSSLSIRADVLGSVSGGGYKLLVEGNKFVPFGLDESFVHASGAGGGLILAPGGVEGWTPNWDTGIDGETAFAGIGPGGEVFGGVWVGGVLSGGVDDGRAGRMQVSAIAHAGGTGWYAGMAWANQLLPTPDLTEVYLTADIQGIADSKLGEEFGDIMLRIEDTDSDWLAFHETMDGTLQFQPVGGPLSEALPGGFGDGVFDVEAGPFAVVLVFDNDVTTTWGFGGTLTFDNLFLTGGHTREAVGAVSFTGSAEPASGFQSVGGLLSDGASTFENVNEDFGVATGTGGGEFFTGASNCDGWTPGWDDGLADEAAFAGCWGSVQVDGGATAEGITSGGLDNGASGHLSAYDIQVVGTGGWWAGLMWQSQRLPDGDLSEILLQADVMGRAGTGNQLGLYHLRIEDADKDFLAFTGQAVEGVWQSVGGPLSDATEGTFIGDGTFHRDHGPFTVVLSFYEEWNSWNSGGELFIDNLFLTPADFGTGAENFSAVVAFASEVDTWGTDGVLTVDNLNVVVVSSDRDGDGDTDLPDFGGFQACFSGDGGGLGAGCQSIDLDGDGDVDLTDFGEFSVRVTGPE